MGVPPFLLVGFFLGGTPFSSLTQFMIRYHGTFPVDHAIFFTLYWIEEDEINCNASRRSLGTAAKLHESGIQSGFR